MPVPAGQNGRPTMSPLPRSVARDTMEGKMARMETFSRVKPICVSLMAIASQSPTPYSQHAKLIDSLLTSLSRAPTTSLDPAVINYVLFPITTILRQTNPSTLPDNFLESSFRLLAYTTRAWRECEGGMDVTAWEQLWKFCTAAIGPRIGGRSGSDKGKGKELGQEVQLQAVLLLTALLEPPSSNAHSLPHPRPSMLERVANTKSPLLPTLFQTITVLLETASPSPTHHQLQLTSLRLLRPLITVYLAGKPSVLAAVLPGTISAMAKIIHASAKGLKGQTAENAIGLIEDVVVCTINDENLRVLGLLRPKVDDLSQLAEEWDSASDQIPPDGPPFPSPSPSSSKPADPFPPLTASYLSFTSNQLLAAVVPILSIMASHSSDLARHAVVRLTSSLIARCFESLSLLIPRSLSILLLLSKDPFDPVRHDAKRSLRVLLENDSLSLDSTILDILTNSINSLPRLVFSQQDLKVNETARVITAIAEITADISNIRRKRKNPISELLGPNGGVERWSWAILNCLEFGRPTEWSAATNSAAKAAQLGWSQQSAASGRPLLLESIEDSNHVDRPDTKFPHLPLRYVESELTSRALGHLLSALGAAGGAAALHSVEYFALFAKSNRRRHIAKSVSAIWVAEKLLDGIATAEMEGLEGRISRSTRKSAKAMVQVLVTIDEDDDDDDEETGENVSYAEDPNAEALIPVERSKGINALTTLLDRKPISDSYTAAETRRLHAQTQRSLLTALTLEAMALTARILSSSFRPLLLTSLYILLSHLASPQQIIREYANIALGQVAYHTGYASPQNMVLDNVDLVINVVSQRLTYRRLSSTAPLVLIAMLRLVGQDLVPLVHDVVDEIFDALDDYHGYETLASSLLAVLVTLIEVMADGVEAEGPSEERMQKVKEMRRVESAPDPKADFDLFFSWWNEKEQRNKEQMEDILQRAPQHAWGKQETIRDDQDQKEDEDTAMAEEQGETPATRSQEVATRILEKSIYFLTHQSPFLRSKVLFLISHAVPGLAAGNRESDFLPLVDKAWNSILNRLDDKEPYVVTEAAETIASLCKNVGDFMSKRVLNHAWPRMRILLHNQRELDRKSALMKRGPTAGSGGAGISMERYTISHRLHLSILDVGIFIAREVPVADNVIWEMSLLFRSFLDSRVEGELREKALRLYKELGRRDGDAVWTALSSTVDPVEGETGGNCWKYLHDDSLEVAATVKMILAQC